MGYKRRDWVIRIVVERTRNTADGRSNGLYRRIIPTPVSCCVDNRSNNMMVMDENNNDIITYSHDAEVEVGEHGGIQHAIEEGV